jgi:DNA-binding IclR family transcriptional regulator
VYIAVLSEKAALYVDQVAGGSALPSHNWVGQHIPLHATSNGKVLLSGLEADEVDRRVESLPAYTELTITNRRKLHRELAEVRAQGYATAHDELEVGLSALAAPIHSAHGDVVASISISGPSYRLPEPRVADLVKLVMEAADDVSRRLGWDRGQRQP